jgi:hypothetical protein
MPKGVPAVCGRQAPRPCGLGHRDRRVFRSGAVIWEQRIAYHEAGHAVIGWALGYRIVAVRLARKGNYRGMTDFGRGTHGIRSAIWSARKVCPQIEAALDVVISLAGRQAEELIAPGAADGGFGWYDRAHMTEVLRTDLGCPGIMRPLISICGKYVDLHRPQIDALAKALLADGIVKAKGIRRILGRRTMPVRSVIFEVVGALQHAELDVVIPCREGRNRKGPH